MNHGHIGRNNYSVHQNLKEIGNGPNKSIWQGGSLELEQIR